mmetsp:Transcript_2182/g.6857  ORF Transcript_2182/g.6857 Transcript_2182/m.6857 type:complete len:82 (+) Transcript_2182:1564-1809(+)|eukprot:scaffold279734_cov26-Tisochrysis_lutea.AAC.2
MPESRRDDHHRTEEVGGFRVSGPCDFTGKGGTPFSTSQGLTSSLRMACFVRACTEEARANQQRDAAAERRLRVFPLTLGGV